jgi:competence protein ComEC
LLILSKANSLKSIISVSVLFCIALLGALHYGYTESRIKNYPFKNPHIKDVAVYGVVSKIELIREKRVTFYIDADSVKIGNAAAAYKSKILCNIYDERGKINQLYNKLKVGNGVEFQTMLIRPRNQRNPYEFDYEKYLAVRGIPIFATSYSTDNLTITENSISTAGNAIYEVRKYLDASITSLHNRTTSGLLRGLLLADRSGIDSQTNTDFMNAGVVHVLSVSGLHVGYIVLIFLFLFNRFNLYWRLFLTVFGLFVYMIITGSEAPVFRSTIMASVLLLTPLLGRESSSYNTLAFAALIILIFNPLELFNPSFQLSFSAILSLILFFPLVKKTVKKFDVRNKFLKYLTIFLASTLIAQLGTLPFTLIYFGRISLTSLAANFFVIPLSGLIVGLGIISIVVSMFSVWLAAIYASCNEFFTYLLLWIAKFFGNPAYSFLSINQFTLYDGILFYAVIGVMAGFWKFLNRTLSKITFTALLLAIFLTAMKFDNTNLLHRNKLTIVSLDVGQGDCFLINFPGGKTALVDCGDATVNFDNGKRVILPFLEKLGIDKLDYVFISHVDSDHYMGIVSLIKEKKVSCVYKPNINLSRANDVAFERILKQNKIPFKHYQHENLQIGNTKLYFMINNQDSRESVSSNDESGVIKLVYGKNSILFTGDAGISLEKKYISKYGSFLKADILKVAHHGSKTSSSLEFLQTVSPTYALISVGVKNKFNHPSKEVLNRLTKLHTKILRTDEIGASILTLNGRAIENIIWR